MTTVYLNAAYFPAVELLSAIGTAAILLYGGYQAIDGNIQIGILVAFVGYLQRVLRPDPADLAALHDLPAGHGGAGQDLRAARHRARHGRRARTRSTRGRSAARSSSRTCGSHTPRSRPGESATLGDCATSTSTFRPARPSRWSARPAPASRRWRSSSRASTTRSEGRVLVDGHDVRELSSSALRASSGSFPRRASCSPARCGRTSPSAGRTRATRRSRPRRAVGADAFIDRLPDGYGHRDRRARRAAVGRPAPAGRLRARAAGRAADPDPRRGDLERRRPDRAHHRARASSGCCSAERRSSSRTACRPSAAPGGSSSSSTAGSPRRAPTRS